MIEKLFSILPDWAQNKLAIRAVYTAGSFISARVIAFLTGPTLDHSFSVVMMAASKIGIPLVIKLNGPVNERVLETFITGTLMVSAEWLIQKFHEKHVVPVVAPVAQQAAQAAVEPAKPA